MDHEAERAFANQRYTLGVIMSEIRLVKQQIGRQWVITSPDVPGLYVADADLEKALSSVEPAVQMLTDMQKRRATRKLLERRVAAA